MANKEVRTRVDVLGAELHDGDFVAVANKKTGSRNKYLELGIIDKNSVYMPDNSHQWVGDVPFKRINLVSEKVVKVREIIDPEQKRLAERLRRYVRV